MMIMLNAQVPSMLDADLKNKIVLVRLDHNVVKKGKIKDSMRIDATLSTLRSIFKQGGLPILMSHVGRPYDKKTGIITIDQDDAVEPIVYYLEEKLQLKGYIPQCHADGDDGIKDLEPIAIGVEKLKNKEVDFVYLPNTRWFKGEEAKDISADDLAQKLAAFADVFINDAFGSWQAHVSTLGVTRYLPSYAGLLMQKEIAHLNKIFDPDRPFLAIVAGAKFDTKIGPLSSLIKICDRLVLGGVIYNAYLAVKHDIRIKGVGSEDIAMAHKFLSDVKGYEDRIVELPFIIESDSIENNESWRVRDIKDLKAGTELNFVLDVSPKSFEIDKIKSIFASSAAIFVNAVMGYTLLFVDGTKSMYQLIDANPAAAKLFGGGDTIQEFKELLPEVFAKAVDDPRYYFFTGGGAILDAIEQGSPYKMKPVEALIKS